MCKGTATLEPELTPHSKPTFVWVYIADSCGYIESDTRVRTFCPLQRHSSPVRTAAGI